MELLERYLGQIKKHLPYKDKEDTIKELRSLILEEFDSRSNGTNEEELIYEIIKEYGYPIEVAARYRDTEPLISGELRPFFYMVLKIITLAVPGVIMLVKIIGFIDVSVTFNLLDLLLEMAYAIPSAINSLLLGYGFVFVIFVLIEKYGKAEFQKEIPEFEPKTLPAIPKDVFKISIFENVFEILMSVAFLYLINLTEGLIKITIDIETYSLLNENFDKMLPFINVSIILALIISIIELGRHKKSHITTTLRLIQTLFSATILFILASNEIFTPIIIEEYGLNMIPNILRIIMYFGGLASIIGGIYNFIKIFRKAKKESE